ncbi:MAG TPA: NADH-quinone oxidoreductase subunit N [Tepidisphaeraceae bacterium]|jgi:NADH-quinone oxidoreductase subunit N
MEHVTSSSPILNIILPEILLAAVACLCMLLGVSHKAAVRRAIPIISIITLLFLLAGLWGLIPVFSGLADPHGQSVYDATNAVRFNQFAGYIQAITLGMGILLVMLAWPSTREGTAAKSIYYGHDTGEFFGLMLLSIAGLMLLTISNDMMVFFLGLELAALPTYIMVAISRPIAAAQEAGVKYFFLGAMAAAMILFGFSYLYGSTGKTDLLAITQYFHHTHTVGHNPTVLNDWEMLAAVTLIAGFAFKLAAFPFHFYAGDVYQGAATPVTAFLAFIPKTTGIVALIKILFVFGGGHFYLPHQLTELLWVLAVCTMTVGNILGVVQPNNVKRVLACSSIAHSGYMLAAIAALTGCHGDNLLEQQALTAVLFYLLAYGIMNIGSFGVLALLPSRSNTPATSAETFDDLAGSARLHPGLALMMAISCFSLIGIPLTVGFIGKILIIRPALSAGLYWLVIFVILNAAVSAAYYLRIIAAMYLRPEPETVHSTRGMHIDQPPASVATLLAVVLSSAGVLLLGIILPAMQTVTSNAEGATQIENIGGGVMQTAHLNAADPQPANKL